MQAHQLKKEVLYLHICHNAIFPFYGALSTMSSNIWQYIQYCFALMPLSISKPKGSPHFLSGFKAVSLAIVAWPRTGQTPYCSGSLLAQPSGSNSHHLICLSYCANLLYRSVHFCFGFLGQKNFCPRSKTTTCSIPSSPGFCQQKWQDMQKS